MRKLFYDRLSTDSRLNAEGFTEHNIYTTHSIDTPDYNKPFIVLRWEGTVSWMAKAVSGPRDLTVWVHDEGDDFTRIDRVLDLLHYDVMPSLVSLHDKESGEHITQVDWQFDGPEWIDDQLRTITRTGNYRVIGR